MIDYEKLIQAIKLAENNNIKFRISLHKDEDYEFYAWIGEINTDNTIHYIDDLIEKLQELTQPKTTHKVNDKIWFLNFNQPDCSLVHDVVINGEDVNYILLDRGLSLPQEKIFSSEEALIESQLLHWSSLMAKEEINKKYFKSNPITVTNGNNACGREDDGHFVDKHEKVCVHEKDKNYSLDAFDLSDLPPHKRCIKCGKFYR